MSYKDKNYPPADDSIKLPAAIRAAAKRSEELQRQANGEAPEEAAAQGGENVEGNEASGAESTPTADGTGEKEKAPEVQTRTDPEVSTQPDGKKTEGVDWEHRYNSIKGRYDRQEDTIRGLNSRISQMEGLLASAQAAAAQREAAPEEQFTSLSAEDRDAYGDEFLDVAARAAQEKLYPEISRLKKQVEELTGKFGQTAKLTKEQTQQHMYSMMDTDLPNWRELNRSPDFLAWANLPDPFSGDIRINMMRNAFELGDGPRVLRFFKGFLADEAALEPVKQLQPEMPKNGKVPLGSFAAPGRAKAPAAQTPPGQKETISRAQISAFYADVHKGKYRGNEQKRLELEAMIFEAENEGRVVN